MTLTLCPLCPDDDHRWGIDKPEPLAAKLLAHHQRRKHGVEPPAATDDTPSQVICDLMWVDPKHDNGRAAILAAITADADGHDGQVDPNRVRDALPAWVAPQLVGAVYNVLLRKGALVPDGGTVNRDRKGRNVGKPQRLYRLMRERVTA